MTASRADRGASGEAAAHGAALAYLSCASPALVDARSADVEIAQQLRTLADSQQEAGVALAMT